MVTNFKIYHSKILVDVFVCVSKIVTLSQKMYMFLSVFPHHIFGPECYNKLCRPLPAFICIVSNTKSQFSIALLSTSIDHFPLMSLFEYSFDSKFIGGTKDKLILYAPFKTLAWPIVLKIMWSVLCRDA